MQEYIFCPFCGGRLHPTMRSGRSRLACSQCGFVRYQNPIPAAVMIAQQGNNVLLIQRGMEPALGEWTLPSGFVEAGESAQECCLRELKEETGLEGDIVSLLNVYYEYSPIYGDILDIFFHVNLRPGIPVAGDDAAEARLTPCEEVKDLIFPCFNQAWKDFRKHRSR